jgi:hypothetical protein
MKYQRQAIFTLHFHLLHTSLLLRFLNTKNHNSLFNKSLKHDHDIIFNYLFSIDQSNHFIS